MYNETIKIRSMGLYITMAVVLPIILAFISIFSLLFGGFGAVLSSIAWIGNMICTITIIVMWHGMIRDINIMCKGDGEELNGYFVALLLGIITLGIYLLYYNYRVQTRLHENASRYNRVISETGTTYLLVTLIGLLFLGIGPFIGQVIIFKNFNKLASGYNDMQEDPLEKPYLKKNQESMKLEKTVPLLEKAPAFNHTVTIPGSVRLLCENGEYQGGSFEIFWGETLSVGRSTAFSNIVLAEEGVSRKHCEFRFADGGLLIKDSSKNGTFVNRNRIEAGKEVLLHDGDKVKIGKTSNVFSIRI